MLENQAGKFLLPTPATVTAAAAALTPRTPPDERLTLVFAPGPDSYPLINYEYAVVSTKQPNPQMADGYQQLSPLVHWTAGRQCTELPRTGAFYCVADTHPCAE